ncbi:autotransporter domain-containing protein [Proteus mirabilis]|uniref:autotransporter domain-containing protein n=8 Tax=Proteus mirabilis TaxID=584 RepID=UPI001E3457AE|nr:autotransporter domain-containing protein [Proteus mirabilis]MCD4589305.1 autotransporter domain-containing protein [Proteus mirabilis]MCD4594198.1 autotransporter domain-containing protein [Proteus mirabilis]MCD4614862.1 autotransporter domain-containing protein [Proteus mirabilis]MCD4632463.1 autotransporter domain-containing protein [Proteus mirabilis]MCD4639167.1 autotransporter domain-containing protein [Proteus mirabilis]
MKMKNKSILYILCPLYIWPINCYSNYNINDMGDSIYNPFSIANNASQYYEFNHNRYEYIKHLHGRVLDKHSYNQQLMTPFGSTYIYATISDDTLSLYNRIADEGERNIQKKIPNYNVRETVYFSEELLPNELFISIDGGKTIKKINKENNPQLDLLYLSHISKNSKTVVGYAFAGARARLEQMVKNNSIFEDTIGCGTYNGCYVFAYNVYNNTFSILDRNMEIRYLTKDGNFILYEYKGDERKKLYIYDIYKKEDFELTFDNVNKYLANHPEKAILLSPITEYPFLKGIKRRGVDIQKISDNGQVFIGQLNRDLPKKKLLDREYPKVAFITTASGPIRELSLSEFGSTKLADTSADGNYSVGWGDVWHYNYAIKLPTRTKTSSAIFSQALLYDFSNDKLINIGNLSKKEEEARFRNARALDITADGKYVVGWSETDEYNLNTIPKDLTGTGPHAFIMFHRHGFIYFNNHMYDLGTLDGGKDSEAHAISDDGRIIYGVATNERNNWRQVIWRNDEIDDKYFNTEQQEIADEKDKQAEQEKAEQERLARLQAEQEKAEQERLARLQAEQEKAEQERLARLQAEQEKAEQERLARLQADKELPPVEDEQVQQAKEKVKEKETAKSSTAISKPIDVENSYKSMQLMAENGYKLIDIQQGQLRYLASATCSVGTEKACLSGFSHYQNIDKANAIQTGISGAYRFDINQTPLVVGLAIDSDSYSSLPTGYEYQGYPLPLIGFSVDLIPSLNPTSNGNALHLSLKGAYVNRKVTIKRPILDNTEAGKGHAKISGYYIDLQGYYPYTLNNLITVTPFAGLTFNQTSRSAYSETQGTKLAVHYQELNAHSLLAKIGLGIEYTVNAKLKLDSKAGLLWHLSHHQGDFQSHIDYLGQQKINYNDNKKQLAQRPFASVGLTYQLDKQSSVNTTTNWQMTPYRNQDIHMGIGYTYRF